MSLVLRLVAAFGLRLYTSLGLHFYSILMSRAKTDIVRLRLVFLCLVLLIILPLIAWANLFSGVVMSSSKIHGGVIGLACLLLWIGPVGAYIATNWRVFNQRVNGEKNINGSLTTTRQKFDPEVAKRKRKRLWVILTALFIFYTIYLWGRIAENLMTRRGNGSVAHCFFTQYQLSRSSPCSLFSGGLIASMSSHRRATTQRTANLSVQPCRI
jgi:hypothetical protein